VNMADALVQIAFMVFCAFIVWCVLRAGER